MCTADVHDCVEKVEILYDVNTADHISVCMTLNVRKLPRLTRHDNCVQNGKVDWSRL